MKHLNDLAENVVTIDSTKLESFVEEVYGLPYSVYYGFFSSHSFGDVVAVLKEGESSLGQGTPTREHFLARWLESGIDKHSPHPKDMLLKLIEEGHLELNEGTRYQIRLNRFASNMEALSADYFNSGLRG